MEDHMKMLPFTTLKILCTLIFMSIFLGPHSASIFAQEPPVPDSTDAQREMVRRARERFGPHVFVDRGGRFAGARDIALGTFPREQLVDNLYGFLQRNSDFLGIENPRQELALEFDRGGNNVRMRQVVNGVNVNGTNVQFYMSLDEGIIINFDFTYYPEARNVNTTPSIDSLQAGAIAQADPIHGDNPTWVNYHGFFITQSRTLGGLFADGQMHLVWKIGVGGGGYREGAFYLIDAHTGEILDVSEVPFKGLPGR
jgi:hypothetical protein